MQEHRFYLSLQKDAFHLCFPDQPLEYHLKDLEEQYTIEIPNDYNSGKLLWDFKQKIILISAIIMKRRFHQYMIITRW